MKTSARHIQQNRSARTGRALAALVLVCPMLGGCPLTHPAQLTSLTDRDGTFTAKPAVICDGEQVEVAWDVHPFNGDMPREATLFITSSPTNLLTGANRVPSGQLRRSRTLSPTEDTLFELAVTVTGIGPY